MSRGAIRAARSPQAAEIAARFGRALKEPEIHWEGNELVLPQITKAQAKAVLAARGHELRATPPRLSVAAPSMLEIRREIMAAAMAARGRPQ